MERAEGGHLASRIDGLVCDLDGVLYVGDTPIQGAAERIARLADDGVRIVYCTNNSKPTVAQYVDKLTAMGLEVDPDDVVTSSVVTGEVLAADGSGRSAVVIGGDGVTEAITAAGIDIVPEPRAEADLVVVGWDLDFTFDKMRRATLAITNHGARLIATNEDAAYPAAEGLWPGTGAIVASIAVASGATAEVMGKPHRPMMDAVARRLEGCERVAVVGDRPDTDLAGGLSRGWTTILVLSGVTKDPSRAEPMPDVVLQSVAEL
ncbi:MAG: HAD-IIA family hydrolase [Actinobacteria bacterium]|nr:HAD-IIA family hydrolase [Actinomycetota bacterium]